MNLRNACGFLSFGLVMGLLPSFAPGFFPASGLDGTSARALWLHVMGAVQTLLGASRLIAPLVAPAIVRWLAVTKPAPAIRPAWSRARIESGDDEAEFGPVGATTEAA